MVDLAPPQADPQHLRRLMLMTKYPPRAPRYTSYPTALQFDQEVGARAYAGWLKALSPESPVSLYLHVPFCRRLCWYCGCNMRVVNRQDPIDDYVEHLMAELRLLQEALPAKIPVSALHFGGGTPNTLSPENLDCLFGRLNDTFAIAENAEIAAELDPATLTQQWVEAATRHGLSRASLGVQDLTPEVQDAVNRHETFELIEQAVGWLRGAGVQSINLDLMYGLPRQTEESVSATLDRVLSLRPDRIAFFGYAHVPWVKPHQKLIDESELPGSRERLRQAESAAQRLKREGYRAIGMDHFALPGDELAIAATSGRLRRNFQGYTADQQATLIGLGASSIGQLPQGFVQNSSDVAAWRKAVRAGQLPIARGYALTDDDRFRGDVIERLMCDLKVDLTAVCARYDRDIQDLDAELGGLAEFIADGLVQRVGDEIRVTELGQPFVRNVAQVFDAKSSIGGQGHSKVL